MKFGDHIQRQRDQDTHWGSHYLNYNGLKVLLERFDTKEEGNIIDDSEEKENSLLITSSQSNMKTKDISEEFSRQLYYEMERLTLFVFEQQGKIAANLASYRIQANQQQIFTLSSSDRRVIPSIDTATLNSTTGDFFIDEDAVGDNERLVPVIDVPTSQKTIVVVGEYSSLPNLMTMTEADSNVVSQTSDLSQRYCDVGRAILCLYQFVDVNVTGIRKILKKHDKIFGGTLGEQFFTPPTYLMKNFGNSIHGSPRSSPSLMRPTQQRNYALSGSQIIQPLVNEDFLGALVVSLESGIQALQQQQQHEYNTTGTFHHGSSRTKESESFKRRSFNELANFRLSPKVLPKKGSRSSSSLGTFLPPNGVDVILSQVRAAQRRLRQTSLFVQYLAAPMMVTRQGSEDDYGTDDASTMADSDIEQSYISNWLNLLSTVFFMTNYYIVAPTSANYAHLLGGNAALASLIIGMTPLAALVSTILYSWWTSYSYKHALIFASVCSTIGNLFYAAGLPCNSLTLVLVGRLLNGFGSARSINRRYIADTFSRQERTAASAAFVTAGAMGMAAGPLLASLLHMAVVRLPNNDGNVYLQSENVSGWFMFCVWTVYTVCLIVYFQDPPRKVASVATTIAESNDTETSPLLIKNDGTPKHCQGLKQSSLWTNGPVMVTLFVYMILKFENEAVLSAAANLSMFYFGWSPSVVGVYLAGLGLMMLPANLIIGYFARRHEDRDLIIGLLVIMVLGGGLMLDYGSLFPYTMTQYMVASFLLFVASTALEGPNMSLLSKSIPAAWSQGAFNVGLLATESGTFGRTIADALLTVFGADGLDHLLNRTFVTVTLISIAALAVCCRYFHHLRPIDREE